jgi:hypothetical protein
MFILDKSNWLITPSQTSRQGGLHLNDRLGPVSASR